MLKPIEVIATKMGLTHNSVPNNVKLSKQSDDEFDELYHQCLLELGVTEEQIERSQV